MCQLALRHSVYELPFLHVYGTNFKWWQLITATPKDSSSQDRHPRNGDLVYLELQLENADHNSAQPAPSTEQYIFAYVKSSIKDTLTESTRVHKEICEYCMLVTLLSSAENVYVLLTKCGYILNECTIVSMFVINSNWLNSHVHWNQFAV
jgi:hypothetical protein